MTRAVKGEWISVRNKFHRYDGDGRPEYVLRWRPDMFWDLKIIARRLAETI